MTLGCGVIWLVRCYPRLVWLITAAVCSVHRKWRQSKAHPQLGHCKWILSHDVVEILLSVLFSLTVWQSSVLLQSRAGQYIETWDMLYESFNTQACSLKRLAFLSDVCGFMHLRPVFLITWLTSQGYILICKC